MSSGGLVGVGVGALLALAGVLSPPAVALTTPGQVYAFGYDGFGELGSLLSEEFEIETGDSVPALVNLPAGATGAVVRIAAGHVHSLALTSTGQLYAFGGNEFGQLGSQTNSGTEESNAEPTLVTLPGANGAVSEIAAGSEHSLVLTSTGQLYAFGENRYGQLGIQANSDTGQANPTPALVSLPGATGQVTQIAAGGGHSLALTSAGQLYAFGDNHYGQLGVATNNGNDEPNSTPMPVTLPGASGTVTQIAAGSEHSLALTSTGQLYAFGWNGYGQLGSEVNSDTSTPNPTPALVTLQGATGQVTQIAAGGNHSLALTSTGQLYAFGDNEHGQLGSEANSGTEEANPTPRLVALAGATGQVTQIAAGRQDSLAVTSSGQLYAFGENQHGQLGSETNFPTTIPNPTPTRVALGGATTEAVARGPDALHTLVLVVPAAGTPPPAGPVGVGSTAGTKQTTMPSSLSLPPTLTSVSVTSRRFRVARQATAISAQNGSLGTTFRFALSAAARLQIALTTTARGLRSGHKCLAPTSGLGREHSTRCTRILTVGTLIRANEPRGGDSVSFSGRIGHRALSPGAYNAALRASDTAGRSRSVTLAFVILH